MTGKRNNSLLWAVVFAALLCGSSVSERLSAWGNNFRASVEHMPDQGNPASLELNGPRIFNTLSSGADLYVPLVKLRGLEGQVLMVNFEIAGWDPVDENIATEAYSGSGSALFYLGASGPDGPNGALDLSVTGIGDGAAVSIALGVSDTDVGLEVGVSNTAYRHVVKWRSVQVLP